MKTLTSALAIGLALASSAASAEPSEEALEEIFRSPPDEARPLIRWWWPGGDVTDEGIRKELAGFLEAGYGGVEIQPFAEGMAKPGPQAQARIDEFATPIFFDHVGEAARAASELGMFVDYTLGSGWPSGGPGITPELSSLELKSTVKTVKGPAKGIQLDLPQRAAFYGAGAGGEGGPGLPDGWEERVAAREKIVAVLAWRGTSPSVEESKGFFGNPISRTVSSGQLTGEAIDLTGNLRADGTLDWDVPEGEWQIFVYRQLPTLQRVTGGVGGGAQLVLDHFDEAAFDAFAKEVLPDSLAEGAGGLRAVFIDSLEVRGANWWSEDFLAQFSQRRGYDLRPYLPFIEQSGWPSPMGNAPAFDMADTGSRVREDYRRTVAELIRERFFEPFNAYVHERGLLTRLQAHGAPGDLLTLYGASDIPETEDLFEGVSPNFLKLASSAGNIYGRKTVSAEAFIIPGTFGYGVTPLLMRKQADALMVNGANELITHGAPYPYQTDTRPYGWYPWGGVFSGMIGTRNPLLPYFEPVNRYIARLQALFQATPTIAPVAILRSEVAYPDNPPSGQLADTPEPEINVALREAGFDFDHVDGTALAASTMADSTVVTPGTARYRAIVVPDVEALDVGTAQSLAAAARAGVKVVFLGNAPVRSRGLHPGGTEQSDSAVQQAVADVLQNNGAAQVEATKIGATLAQADIAPNVSFANGQSLPILTKALPDEGRLHFFVNSGDAAAPLKIEVPKGFGIEQWDAWTGTVTPQRLGSGADEGTFAFTVPAGESMLLALVRDGSTDATNNTVEQGSVLMPLTRWSVGVDGFDETGTPVHLRKADTALADWAEWLGGKGVSGAATYRTRVNLDAGQIAGPPLVLDLGTLGDSARVTVNGCKVTAPFAPYTVAMSGMLKPGVNDIQVETANTPLNATRLDPGGIGKGPTEPELAVAGLIGPAALRKGGTARWQAEVGCAD